MTDSPKGPGHSSYGDESVGHNARCFATVVRWTTLLTLRKLIVSLALPALHEKSDFSVQPLRSLCLCGCFSYAIFNHRGTEYAEIAQRRACVTTFRASPTKPNGMGMGLRISRSLIEGHGGRLWAAPNVPHGAMFSFTLLVTAESPSSL
jgi:hypothetical protein